MFIGLMNGIVNKIENYYFVKIIDLNPNRRINYYFYENWQYHFESKNNLLFILLFLWNLFIS